MAEEVCRENMVLGQSIKDTVFHTASNGVITVRVRFSFHADKLNEKKNRQMITAILEGLSGRTWQIVYEINGVAPRRQAAASLPDISSVFGTPNS